MLLKKRVTLYFYEYIYIQNKVVLLQPGGFSDVKQILPSICHNQIMCVCGCILFKFFHCCIIDAFRMWGCKKSQYCSIPPNIYLADPTLLCSAEKSNVVICTCVCHAMFRYFHPICICSQSPSSLSSSVVNCEP